MEGRVEEEEEVSKEEVGGSPMEPTVVWWPARRWRRKGNVKGDKELGASFFGGGEGRG